jgi:hypothetical protein
MSTNPWGDPPYPETNPEEFARVMAAFDEIQRGYDRDAKRLEWKIARRQSARAARDLIIMGNLGLGKSTLKRPTQEGK